MAGSVIRVRSCVNVLVDGVGDLFHLSAIALPLFFILAIHTLIVTVIECLRGGLRS